MIENRPASLLADATYGILPKLPLAIDWSSVPELIRVATLDLGGIQPVTKAMAEAAGGTLHDKPSEGEIELFRKGYRLNPYLLLVKPGQLQESETPSQLGSLSVTTPSPPR